MFRAVEKENIEIIKLLLACNDDINVNAINKSSSELCNSEKTALFAAVEKENIEIIKLLLQNDKIDVNIVNNIDYTTGGGDMSYWYYTAIYESFERENIEIVKLLLANANIDVNSDNEKHEDHQGGGDPNEGKFLKTLLYRAIEKENIEIVKLLLTFEEIDIDIISSKEGKEDDDPVLWEKTALFKAVEKENIEIIKLLLTEDFDINIKNYDSGELDEDEDEIDINNMHCDEIKGTALFLAVKKKNIKIIKLLLTNLNNDLNIHCKINGEKTTVLELAAKINDDEITKVLSEYKIKQTNKQTIDEDFNIIDKIKEINCQIQPDLKVTLKAGKYLNLFIDHLLEKVTQKMDQIIEKNDQKTINYADIEKILSCFHMAGDVLNFEIREAYKCVDKLHSNKNFSLVIPINTIRNYIQKRITNGKINDDAYYFIEYAIETLLVIILENSGNISREHRREYISLRSTIIALIKDEELSFLFQNINNRELRKNFIPKPFKVNRLVDTF